MLGAWEGLDVDPSLQPINLTVLITSSSPSLK